MSDLRGYAAAQREYDNRTPPDDGPSECDACGGCGKVPMMVDDTLDDGYEVSCANCDGHGWLDADGEPFNPNAKTEAEEARAEYERDRRRDEGGNA